MNVKIVLIPCMGCEKNIGKIGTLAAFSLEKSNKFPFLRLNPSITQIAAGEYTSFSSETLIIALNCCNLRCTTKILHQKSIKPHYVINISKYLKDLTIPKGVISVHELIKDSSVSFITERLSNEIEEFVVQFTHKHKENSGIKANEPSISKISFTFTPNYSKMLEFTFSKFKFQVPIYPNQLFFNWNDSWAYYLGEGKVVIGITDYMQKNLSDILICEFSEMGTNIGQFEAVAELESSKTVNEVLSPFSGKIIAVNTKLEEAPELINEDPYNNGWIVILECNNFEEESSELMSSEEYFNFMKEKIEQEGIHQ